MTTRTSTLLAATIVALTGTTAAAAPAKVWDETYGGDAVDTQAIVLRSSLGGYLLAGSSTSLPSGVKTAPSKGQSDYWVVQIAADGTKQWDRGYGGSGWDTLTAAVATPDGGYILGGYSDSPMSIDKSANNFNGSHDFWLIKIDANGNKVWDRTYGGNDGDTLQDLVLTSTALYAVGTSISPMGGNKAAPSKGSDDYWVLKLSVTSGAKLWDRSFGGTSRDQRPAAAATASGLVLAGLSISTMGADKSAPAIGGSDYWIVHVDANGNKLWDRTYGGTGNDAARDVVVTAGGEIVVLGDSASPASGNKAIGTFGGNDFWLLQLDGAGTKLLERGYGGTLDDRAARIVPAATGLGGHYVLAGTSTSGVTGNKTVANNGGSDGWLVDVDATAFGIVWDLGLGGALDDTLGDVLRVSDGYVVGLSSLSNMGGDKTDNAFAGSQDYWTVKLH